RPVPDASLADSAQAALAARFDETWGGFTRAPKFPSPPTLDFPLERASDEEAREMLVTTLDRMARGGIHDQLAGGFHRYSTDAEWLPPPLPEEPYQQPRAAPPLLHTAGAP